MSNYPPPSQGYYPPPYQPAPRTSTTAIVSLIAGIAGWIFLPVLGPIIAVITGHMAKGEIRHSNGQVVGEGLATAGLILGYFQLIVALCAICIISAITLLGLGGGIFEGFRQGIF